MSGALARVALLAHPAGHSLSPLMHNAAFEDVGIDAHYEALDVAPAELPTVMNQLRRAPYLGANVTVPHKEAVLHLVDELTPAAAAVGAVNTLIRRGARLVGHNTDGAGFVQALGEIGLGATAGLSEANCLVLGAGGAARAVVHALLAAGASVHVANRNPERAAVLAADLGSASGATNGAYVAADVLELLPTTNLLINTTSVGMRGGSDPYSTPLIEAANLDLLPIEAAVVDLVYRPAVTPLLAAAESRGLLVQNGLPMLVRQGALAFEAWTGVEAPVSVMRQAAERGLDRNAG